MSKIDYKKSGVNIELGDEASKILFAAAKKTWKNRKGKIGEIVAPFDDFSGVRVVDVSSLPEGSLMCLGFDGVGTKVEIAERVGRHDTVAFDLFAMVCDDAVVRGGEPVIIGSVLDINCLESGNENHLDFLRQIADGYVKAAGDANVAIINGEMAELGSRISGFGPFNYNWGAGLVWFAKKDRLFTGNEVKAGDKIVALRENGFRSNGLSLVRKILSSSLGDDWHTDNDIANKVLEPSVVYSKAVCKLNGGFANKPVAEVHGVVHVTGGGVPGKLGRVLRPTGLGAVLDDLFDPCDLMLRLQELGGVEDDEAYRTWNMGQGMLVITNEPEKVIRSLEKDNIQAKVCGTVTDESGIKIKNKAFFKKISTLEF